MSQTRQLAAIMFTDIVHYSALMSIDEAKALELLDQNIRLQKPIIKSNSGNCIKDLGDGILASFFTATDAVNCACRIIEGCASVEGLKLRIGIHLGEVLFQNNDVFGDGVNIAFRLQSIAPVNGIYISEAVRNTIVNRKEIKSIFIRKETLKNIKEPINIYEIIVRGNLSSSMPDNVIESKSENNGEKSIAVLPFVNMSNDPNQEYFSDGISEEILNYLSRVKGLKVAARTSSFYFKNKNEDLRRVGKQLNVNFILEGSVRKDKDIVRVTAQLVSIKDGFHLWSKSYDRQLNNIFHVQEEIAGSVTEKLKLSLAKFTQSAETSRDWVKLSGDLSLANSNTDSPKSITLSLGTNNIDAYDHYLKGNYFTYKFQFELAASSYEKAIELDAGFSDAHLMLAKTYQVLSTLLLISPIRGYGNALKVSYLATVFDERQISGHITTGYIKLFLNWDLKSSEKYFKLVLKIDPANILAISGLAYIYFARHDFKTADTYITEAVNLEPANTSLQYQKSLIEIFLQRFEKAIERIQNLKTVDSNETFNAGLLSMAYVGLKDFESAYMITSTGTIGEEFGILNAAHAINLAMIGNIDRAQEILKAMLTKASGQWCSALSIAFTYAALKDMDNAYDWLEKALLERHFYFLMMFDRTYWDLVREDPRFNQFQERVAGMKTV